MSTSRKLLQRRAKAEAASLSTMLSRLEPDDYLGRVGLESRLKELEEVGYGAEEELPETMASANLFFGGEPVIGSTGIESGFAGRAISTFQDLVAKLAIEDRRFLGQRGPLPAHDDAKLHVTGILRGSFGFRLEELQPIGSIFATSLKGAVERATHMLEAFSDASEESFEETLGATDPRSLMAARDFFALLGANNATLRLQAGEAELEISRPAIERARERALSSQVDEDTRYVDGRLSGLLPDAHMFELEIPGQDVLSGKVTRALEKADLAELLRTYLNQPVRAKVLTRKVFRKGQLARQSHTLQELAGPDLLSLPQS
jgi:hypothetical protein